jgi:hypothetical protein
MHAFLANGLEYKGLFNSFGEPLINPPVNEN